MSIWLSPPAGKILNNGADWKRGDIMNVPLQLEQHESLVVIAGTLPPGITFVLATRSFNGVVDALDKNKTSYTCVMRATRTTSDDVVKYFDRTFTFPVEIIDEAHHWSVTTPENPTWQDAVNLGSFNRGSSVSVVLDPNFVNPDNDALYYSYTGVNGPDDSFSGLPNGLEIDQYGRLVGSPTITDNFPGTYYFRVYVRTELDMEENPKGEGNPKTSQKIFSVTLLEEIILDPRLSDTVTWITPPGLLGSVNETDPSYFGVEAVPQFSTQAPNEDQVIRYYLIQTSAPLPKGLLLNSETGAITGRTPYVNFNRTYTFTIEAVVAFIHKVTGAIRFSAVKSERTFSIIINNVYTTNSVTSLIIRVPPNIREKIAYWIYGTRPERDNTHRLTVIGNDTLYKPEDTNFGKKTDYNILLLNGLKYERGSSIHNKMLDYHHPTNLMVGSLKSAIARSPSGEHLYDVVYFEIIDPVEKVGGFNDVGWETILSRNSTIAIPKLNIVEGQPVYYPMSIHNARMGLMSTSNRQAAPWYNETASQRGIGIAGTTEALPYWMTSEQIVGDSNSVLGYTPAIEVAYLLPNTAVNVVRALSQAGINTDLSGSIIYVDRYLLQNDTLRSTTFDGPENPITPTALFTDFDGPTNADTPTYEWTVFDEELVYEKKYYKFSPGDKEIQ